jgi:hypothetical protein
MFLGRLKRFNGGLHGYFFRFFAIKLCVIVAIGCNCENISTQNDHEVEKSQKVDHQDITPSIIKKTGPTDQLQNAFQKTKTGMTSSVSYKNGENISLVCYRSGACLVKDTRNVKVHPGINEIKFDNIYPGIVPESINFITPKKGKITVLSYTIEQKDLSKDRLLSSSVSEDISYFFDGNGGKLETGRLVGISKDDNKKSYAMINNAGKCFWVPLEKCVAISEKALSHTGRNSLKLICEAEEQDDIVIEINYLISNLSWKHYCLIEVFRNLDRVDIFSQALVQNNTDQDMENVFVAFDTSFQNVMNLKSSAESLDLKNKNQNVCNYRRNLTIKKNSKTMCMLKAAKFIKPSLEYIAKIPISAIDGSLSKEIDLAVNYLLTVNAKSAGIDTDFYDSDALIFRRTDGERSFLGRQVLSSIKKDDDFVFEIGNAPDVIASVQQTDFRKLSEKSIEYGVRVTVKNNKANDVAALIVVDTTSTWNVIKRNFEMQKSEKPVWRLELKQNESKELHFRIRLEK